MLPTISDGHYQIIPSAKQKFSSEVMRVFFSFLDLDSLKRACVVNTAWKRHFTFNQETSESGRSIKMRKIAENFSRQDLSSMAPIFSYSKFLKRSNSICDAQRLESMNNNELPLLIFSFLDVNGLAKCCLVCKEWEEIALITGRKNWDIYPCIAKETFFVTLSSWKDCLNSTEVLDGDDSFMRQTPTLASRDTSSFILPTSHQIQWIVTELHSFHVLVNLFNSFRLRNNAGLTFVEIPQGMNLNRLLGYAREVVRMSFETIEPQIIETLGNCQVAENYTIAIGGNVIDQTSTLYQEKYAMVTSCVVENTSWQLPTVLEGMHLFVVQEIMQKQLINTSTFCQEQNGEVYILGKHINEGRITYTIQSQFSTQVDVGVIPVWRGSVPGNIHLTPTSRKRKQV